MNKPVVVAKPLTPAYRTRQQVAHLLVEILDTYVSTMLHPSQRLDPDFYFRACQQVWEDLALTGDELHTARVYEVWLLDPPTVSQVMFLLGARHNAPPF